MKVELRVKDEFEAAHSLPTMPEGHKCRRLHGHRYQVEIACAGEPTDGMLIEYETMQAELATVLGALDHHFLDEIISPSTTENLCAWLWAKLQQTKAGPLLVEIRVQETSTTSCLVRG